MVYGQTAFDRTVYAPPCGCQPAGLDGREKRRIQPERSLLTLLMLFCCPALFGQNLPSGAYLIPPKVYVGDRATLILPLPRFTGAGGAEIAPSQIPFHGDIDIHRIAVERRPGGSRLILEFTAFTPGILELPPLEIAGERFSRLKVEIASILEPGESGYALSGPAPPLAIPGTSLLIYGTIAAVVLLASVSAWALLWGRSRINGWLTAMRRKRLLAVMARIEKRLRRALARGESRRGILDTLSSEFRSFLAWFTGVNCRAMTAAELLGFPVDNIYFPRNGELFPGEFLSRCDSIRFCGSEISEDETASMLDNIKYFLRELDKNMRGKTGGEAA